MMQFKLWVEVCSIAVVGALACGTAIASDRPISSYDERTRTKLESWQAWLAECDRQDTSHFYYVRVFDLLWPVPAQMVASFNQRMRLVISKKTTISAVSSLAGCRS